jgi:hypothetical protein
MIVDAYVFARHTYHGGVENDGRIPSCTYPIFMTRKDYITQRIIKIPLVTISLAHAHGVVYIWIWNIIACA